VKIGCSGETHHNRVREAERGRGDPPGLTMDERTRLKELEWKNRELRQADDIRRKTSACFAAAEFDRR